MGKQWGTPKWIKRMNSQTTREDKWTGVVSSSDYFVKLELPPDIGKSNYESKCLL